MFQYKTDRTACVALLLLSLFIFTQSLSIHGLEFRDDEIFYYKSTQEMIESGNVLSPTYFGEDRFQKPILYYWLVLGSYKIFGPHWFGARFVAVIFAGLTVCLTWLIGRTLFNRSVGTLSAVILMTVPLFFRHAKNAVPDMVLNFFVVAALYCAIRFLQCTYGIFSNNLKDTSSSNSYSWLFFIACGLGFMIKGYTAIIVPFSTVIIYAIFSRRIEFLADLKFGRGLLILLLIICPWFIYMYLAHGQSYLEYMLVNETKNRVATGNGNFIIKFVTTFIDHNLFYLNVLGSYFAPWCIFLLGAIPLAFKGIQSKEPEREGYRFLLVWFLAVFCFFSMIYFSINHYLLVLSTPFAILVSCFCLKSFDQKRLFSKVITLLRKYMAFFIFTIGSLAYVFLFVFLSGASNWWLLLLLPTILLIVTGVLRSLKPMVAPLSLGLLILFVFAQSTLLGKAGITSHAVLQKFAATIQMETSKDSNADYLIGVGSHDIHEKEFQVYFDQKVTKAAGSDGTETKRKLDQLFSTNQPIFCLMTESDFNDYLKSSFNGSLEVIQEDYIMRRRMNIDKGFFTALLKFDQKTVSRYLKEKLVLVKRRRNV